MSGRLERSPVGVDGWEGRESPSWYLQRSLCGFIPNFIVQTSLGPHLFDSGLLDFRGGGGVGGRVYRQEKVLNYLVMHRLYPTRTQPRSVTRLSCLKYIFQDVVVLNFQEHWCLGRGKQVSVELSAQTMENMLIVVGSGVSPYELGPA